MLSNSRSSANGSLRVKLADRAEEIKAAQNLRFRVFAEEMGAQLNGAESSLDQDAFDAFCHHLIVYDRQEVIACTRILTDNQARQAGGYYSEVEFDLSAIHALDGSLMEVGRTCVHPAYRNGAAIAVLWSGLAQFMVNRDFDYLMGCASVPLTHDGPSLRDVYEHLRFRYLSPAPLRVTPRSVMPEAYFQLRPGFDPARSLSLPPLLKAYMRLGAYICGEPSWDAAFNVADLFVLLDRRRLNQRYARHFIKPRQCKENAAVCAAGGF